MTWDIRIVGAQENNLKNISLTIAKNKLTVVTGVSGSGKSSLIYDTIAKESMRQLYETFPLYIRNRMPHYEPPKVAKIDGLSPAIIVRQRPFTGDNRSTVATMTDVAPLLRLLFSRIAEPTLGSSQNYSFNDPQGMCPVCSGLGYTVEFDVDKFLDKEKSLNEGAILFPGHQVGTYQWQMYANSGFFSADKPLKQFTEKEWQDFLHGSDRIVNIRNTTGKVWGDYTLTYEGLLDRISRLYLKRNINAGKSNKKILEEFTSFSPCPECQGSRLNHSVLESKISGLNIFEAGEIEIVELISFLDKIKSPKGKFVAQKIIQILKGIEYMGLGYLNLNRPSTSLSGGEAQRLRMVRHLGTSLIGLTYIFDEPTAGLHQKDAARLGNLLLNLRDRGNTILVVEHNDAIIRIADEIIDMGPGAGKDGGRIIFQGSRQEFFQQSSSNKFSKTLCLKKQKKVLMDFLTVPNASLHNLKNITVHIPKNALTLVTGMAGAGKTSLVCSVLPKFFPQAVHISQAPIGITSRSTTASYIGIMDEIRKLFAKANKVSPSLLSFNSKGACPVCAGKGVIKTEMAFLDPVEIPCEACHGTRYNDEALACRLNGKNILDVLKMTASEALDFFTAKKITDKLQTLCSVGLSYLTLGQHTSTLSGGECQRLKLTAHLKEKNRLYLIDEPTTGLHPSDTEKLLAMFEFLIRQGNTLVVIEHDLQVIATADWIIDLGPEGGTRGGQLLFEGRLADFIECKNSPTAECLREALKNKERELS